MCLKLNVYTKPLCHGAVALGFSAHNCIGLSSKPRLLLTAYVGQQYIHDMLSLAQELMGTANSTNVAIWG